MSAVIAFLTGSQDAKEINIMAKQASEVREIIIILSYSLPNLEHPTRNAKLLHIMQIEN